MKRPKDELEFDLRRVRLAKRLMKRALKELERIERDYIKFKKDRQTRPNDEEREAVNEFYQPEE